MLMVLIATAAVAYFLVIAVVLGVCRSASAGDANSIEARLAGYDVAPLALVVDRDERVPAA